MMVLFDPAVAFAVVVAELIDAVSPSSRAIVVYA